MEQGPLRNPELPLSEAESAHYIFVKWMNEHVYVLFKQVRLNRANLLGTPMVNWCQPTEKQGPKAPSLARIYCSLPGQGSTSLAPAPQPGSSWRAGTLRLLLVESAAQTLASGGCSVDVSWMCQCTKVLRAKAKWPAPLGTGGRHLQMLRYPSASCLNLWPWPVFPKVCSVEL